MCVLPMRWSTDPAEAIATNLLARSLPSPENVKVGADIIGL